MRDLFRGNLRRDLITAGTLLAFATVAMAAAQWGTFSPGEAASLTGEQDTAFRGDADRTLPSQAPVPRVPMFTTGGSPVAEGALPADPVLPPPPQMAAASATSSAGGFGTWSQVGAGWHAAGGFGSDDRSPVIRGASSASGVGSVAGMGGGGAWGGVSGTATKTKETVVAGASSRVVQATKTASTPPRNAASGSSRDAAPGLSTSPAFSSMAAGPVAAAAAPLFTPGTVESLKDPALAALRDTPSDSPSSAPTPEPLSFILVGVGLAGVYAMRKHLR